MQIFHDKRDRVKCHIYEIYKVHEDKNMTYSSYNNSKVQAIRNELIYQVNSLHSPVSEGA